MRSNQGISVLERAGFILSKIPQFEAAYSDPDDLRVVLVGDQEDLDDMMSYARPITLSDLKALCEQVDPLWNEMSQADRSSAKGLRP